MTRQLILSVEGFSKTFHLHEQNKILPSASDVYLKAFSGELTALVGPTGVGKSSILKSIYRTYLPTTGKILYRTQENQVIDVAQADEHQVLELRRLDIGFVTQFLHFLPRQSTLDIVATPLYNRGIPRGEAQEQAKAMLHKLSLPERLWEVSPATFSGGEKQRVNLARGLLAKPRLLLLDEPTASLDARITEQVIDLIDDTKHQGIAMLAIFHQPELVKRLADHIVELTPIKENL